MGLDQLVQGHAEKEQLDEIKKAHSVQYAPSRFTFLNIHQGLRPGCFHGLLGRSGCGKSRLTQSIISDTAQTNKVLVILTEEEKLVYEEKMRFSSRQYSKENIFYLHQDNFPGETIKDLFLFLRELVLEKDIKFIFWDNLTTSKFYEGENPKTQWEFMNVLVRMAAKRNIGIFAVLHTGKQIMRDRLISGEDVRGCNQLYQKAPYFYILNRIVVESVKHIFLEVNKHRFHEIEKIYYQLKYEDGIYTMDRDVNFKEINDVFIERDKLGRRKSTNTTRSTEQPKKPVRSNHYTEMY
jgi:hypothetical protein